ncbi:MAG: hypothetical protein L6416_09285 [Candidatus Omnitrophica bacterium]|nr:hypothetical protein [Candidatus Omnitrophota bacterium]
MTLSCYRVNVPRVAIKYLDGLTDEGCCLRVNFTINTNFLPAKELDRRPANLRRVFSAAKLASRLITRTKS